MLVGVVHNGVRCWDVRPRYRGVSSEDGVLDVDDIFPALVNTPETDEAVLTSHL